ncbi:MAG: hypothetical protein RL641_422 [Candidatus Parcubacteria bacterium]
MACDWQKGCAIPFLLVVSAYDYAKTKIINSLNLKQKKMKKQFFILLSLNQVMVGGTVAKEIVRRQSGTSEMLIIDVADEKAMLDLPRLIKEKSSKDIQVVLLGDIRGHESNRDSFNQRSTLVDAILVKAGHLNDPAFAELREYATLISSPFIEQTIVALGAKAGYEESNPGNYPTALQKMSQFLTNGFVPNQKVATFIQQNLNPENFSTREIKADAKFLKRPVTIGVLQTKGIITTGLSMKAVIPWAKMKDEKPVDFLVVNDGKTIELVYQPWAQSLAQVVKETFKKNGYILHSPTPANKHKGLMFTIPTSGAVSPEKIFSLMSEATKVAEQAVLNSVPA